MPRLREIPRIEESTAAARCSRIERSACAEHCRLLETAPDRWERERQTGARKSGRQRERGVP